MDCNRHAVEQNEKRFQGGGESVFFRGQEENKNGVALKEASCARIARKGRVNQ